jgi:hypothetical protein
MRTVDQATIETKVDTFAADVSNQTLVRWHNGDVLTSGHFGLRCDGAGENSARTSVHEGGPSSSTGVGSAAVRHSVSRRCPEPAVNERAACVCAEGKTSGVRRVALAGSVCVAR